MVRNIHPRPPIAARTSISTRLVGVERRDVGHVPKAQQRGAEPHLALARAAQRDDDVLVHVLLQRRVAPRSDLIVRKNG